MKIYLRILLKRIFFCSSVFTVFFTHSAYRLAGGIKDELEKMPPLYRSILTFTAEEEIRKIIQTQGKDLDLSDGEGTDTALHLLIRQQGKSRLDLVRTILNNLDVDLNEYEYSLLHEAAKRQYPTAVIMLVDEFKANVNAVDSGEESRLFTTPLHISAFHGYMKTMKALVNRGADINAKDNRGQTPLHISAAYGQVSHELKTVSERKEMFRLLINNNINVQDKEGRTPLHLAAFHGMPNSVKALLALGADAQIKDIEGNTPYNLALKRAKEYAFSDKYKIVKNILIIHQTQSLFHPKKNSWIKRSSDWCRRTLSGRQVASQK